MEKHMENAELAKYIDLTLLKQDATAAEIRALCEQAKRMGAYAVCVQPVRVALAAELLAGSDVLPISVISFPHGSNTPAVKAEEALLAIEDGAREIDMVMNVGSFKDGDYKLVAQDIRRVIATCEDVPVKVILETALLSYDDIIHACRLAEQEGAAFVKTSTGFNAAGGATINAVLTMRDAVGGRMGIKAAGGIRTRTAALEYIAAGATRIGASSASILDG